MALFTTTLGLYGGVLWSGGELQGFIAHETVPVRSAQCLVPSASARAVSRARSAAKADAARAERREGCRYRRCRCSWFNVVIGEATRGARSVCWFARSVRCLQCS
jgi:hypothetical protein